MTLETRRRVRRSWARFGLAAALTLAGCGAGGGLVNMWKDPAYPKAPLRNVLVVVAKKDEIKRRIMEDEFVTALSQRGVATTPSYRLWANDLPDTQQVVDAIRAKAYDGVVVVSKLDNREETSFVPGYSTREARTEWNRWSQSYQTYFTEVHTPGYTETETIVRHRVDVWSTGEGDGRLVWTAVGNSVNPGSSAQVHKEVLKQVVPELVHQRVIP
jgi:hypothetical protein